MCCCVDVCCVAVVLLLLCVVLLLCVGASHDSPRNQHADRARELQTPRKFHERTPKREREREERKMWREGKNSAKFWASPPSRPHPSRLHPSGPNLRGLTGPTFSRFGPHPSNPPPFTAQDVGLKRHWPPLPLHPAPCPRGYLSLLSSLVTSTNAFHCNLRQRLSAMVSDLHGVSVDVSSDNFLPAIENLVCSFNLPPSALRLWGLARWSHDHSSTGCPSRQRPLQSIGAHIFFVGHVCDQLQPPSW